jgi:uncharacterized membrane protein YphA (DoxX/SURF4 family)
MLSEQKRERTAKPNASFVIVWDMKSETLQYTLNTTSSSEWPWPESHVSFLSGSIGAGSWPRAAGETPQFATSGDFFMSLKLPFPGQTALGISYVEFFGSIFLALGILSRTTALVLTVNMLMAYVTADREALLSIFTNADKFYAAAPYTFLVASVIILLFGPGKIALDGILRWLAFSLSSRRLLQCR